MKTFEYYMAMPYKLEIFEDKHEGGYAAFYPDLPGCVTCGETTLEGVKANAEDAKGEWIIAALEDGIKIRELV